MQRTPRRIFSRSQPYSKGPIFINDDHRSRIITKPKTIKIYVNFLGVSVLLYPQIRLALMLLLTGIPILILGYIIYLVFQSVSLLFGTVKNSSMLTLSKTLRHTETWTLISNSKITFSTKVIISTDKCRIIEQCIFRIIEHYIPIRLRVLSFMSLNLCVALRKEL